MNEAPGLIEQIQLIAATLPFTQVEQLAACLQTLDAPEAQGRARAVQVAGSPRFKTAVAGLWQAWEADPSVNGASIALALRTSGLTTDRMRSSSSLEVVWTGPTTNQVPVRQSAQVLERLIEDARRRLIVVSFAAYKVASVETALREAADRGVRVDLILETAADSKGAVNVDAAEAFEKLQGAATFWVWPGRLRPQEGAVLHAKVAICDSSSALVTSANLTGRALERNMELGLLITGGPVPRRLADHFDSLMSNGTLNEISAS